MAIQTVDQPSLGQIIPVNPVTFAIRPSRFAFHIGMIGMNIPTPFVVVLLAVPPSPIPSWVGMNEHCILNDS